HATCLPSKEKSDICEYCLKKNLMCIKYKPQYIEQEIVRLNQVVIDKDQEIKLFQKQLIAYRLLKQQVESLFTILELE
ncbi:8745_t:CDS:1, partial [Gigaspora margarita]